MPNKLIHENSLYLKQHAHNPVDWWAWGDEALAEAKRLNKPILVSIGYSACHWCHVMAHECFEDDYIAGLMNRHFICIKVDREERPAVDQFYMDAVQMITGRGGWPLNAFCLPDGKPFFGGTYFPPEDRGQGIIPWPQLIIRIADHYAKEQADLLENAENILKNMQHANQPFGESRQRLENQALLSAAEAICEEHDEDWGGFGQAPKFPPSMTLDFLLEVRSTKASDNLPNFAEKLDLSIQRTLRAMARGGIYDQIGGGFARYSVDRYWAIPHFEKMLYDNALLIDVYVKGYCRYQTPVFKNVVEETIAWLDREMALDTGGYAAALDADSEGEEGKYYVWNRTQIEAVLGAADAERFCKAYNITERGNFEHGFSNPLLNDETPEIRVELAPLREKLLAARAQRVPPARDPKLVLSWNALLVRALAEAGYYLERRDWLQQAINLADYLWENLRDSEGHLRAVAYEGKPAEIQGTLDDYAYFAEACLSLAATGDTLDYGTHKHWVNRAEALVATVFKHFSDADAPGFYTTADDEAQLSVRKKEWLDNATPAGNSCMVHVLSGLYALTADSKYAQALDNLRTAYPEFADKAPNAVSHALAGFTANAMGIPVVKLKDVNVLPGLQRSLVQRPWRRCFIHVTRDASQPDDYVLCIGSQCQPPTDNPHRIAAMV